MALGTGTRSCREGVGTKGYRYPVVPGGVLALTGAGTRPCRTCYTPIPHGNIARNPERATSYGPIVLDSNLRSGNSEYKPYIAGCSLTGQVSAVSDPSCAPSLRHWVGTLDRLCQHTRGSTLVEARFGIASRLVLAQRGCFPEVVLVLACAGSPPRPKQLPPGQDKGLDFIGGALTLGPRTISAARQPPQLLR